jgi:GH18 family chitinase
MLTTPLISGNGEDYKIVPNKDKAWEIRAFPLLLAEIRGALGPEKIISAAVPGRPEDMIAFDRRTVPRIMRHLDFLNVMTYDLAGRRDNVTKHHTGVQNSLVAINEYLTAGATPQQLNLGFAFYVKWFLTEDRACSTASSGLGCPTLLGEDPETGADLGHVGMFSWHDPVPKELEKSFTRAVEEGIYDDKEGGYYYCDDTNNLFWTFDTAGAISRKFPLIVDEMRLGGVFAWGLGEDAPAYEHFSAAMDGVAKQNGAARKGL